MKQTALIGLLLLCHTLACGVAAADTVQSLKQVGTPIAQLLSEAQALLGEKSADGLLNIGSRAPEKVARAETLIREVLTREPGNARALDLLGQVGVATSNSELAASAFTKAAELAPRALESVTGLAVLAQSFGSLDQAISLYRIALALEPDSPVLKFRLAGALSLNGDFAPAKALYEEALKAMPADCQLGTAYGELLIKMREIDTAIARLQTTIKDCPSSQPALINLGNALALAARYQEALESYETARRVFPGYAPVHVAVADMEIKLGRDDEAKESYRAALAINEHQAAAHLELGRILNVEGNFSAALVEFMRALQDSEDYPQSIEMSKAYLHAQMSYSLMRLGAYQEAIERADAALTRDRTLVDVYKIKAYSLEALGRRMAADRVDRELSRMEAGLDRSE